MKTRLDINHLSSTTTCSDSLTSLVNDIKVISYTAESRNAQIKKFNKSAMDKQQNQFFTVVKHHRKIVTKWRKEGITSSKID